MTSRLFGPLTVATTLAALAIPLAMTSCASPRFAGEHQQPRIAPEIEGVDFDGEQFRLSDYRGKVVVLDFWGHW